MSVLDSKMKIMKESIISYMDLVEKMLDMILNGIHHNKMENFKEVFDELEPQANVFRDEISQEALALLALFHPEACDLRSIVKMSEMGGDLERMADMLTKTSLAIYHWHEEINIAEYPRIPEMMGEVRKMLKDIRQAFIDENILLCVAVIQYDDRIDDLQKQIIKQLIKQMNTSDKVDALIQVLNIARFLERMADLATHIAEDIIFIKEGLVPNHNK